MSLEDALAANTAAIEKHTAALESFVKAAKSGAAPAAEPKAEAKAETKAAPKAAAKKAKKEPWETHEDFIAFCGEYLKAGDTKENKQRIRDTVAPVLAHLGVGKFSEIGEDQREEAYGYMKQLADALAEGGLDASEAVDLGLSNEAGNDDLV